MFVIFSTKLGWFGACSGPRGVRRTTMGHPSKSAARKALAAEIELEIEGDPWDVVSKIVSFSGGERVDLRSVPLDLPPMTSFRSRVLLRCHEIPYGETISYGQLARLAGSPQAARAVGSAMANNPLPILIPCHRVVAANDQLGGFSAPTGLSLKKQMLRLEASLPG
ncbi:MAG: cysteine methyltransferase [Planctomycetaceae bacterium]|nr:cysteine methyltransferase [Planctomycetaceae bacterium]